MMHVIDPALKDTTVIPHASRKNKGAAMLHPTDEDLSVRHPRIHGIYTRVNKSRTL
jgi:hypothetical protein